MRRSLLLISVIAVVFLILRLPGTSLPLHQDEYKWPLITNPATAGDTSIPHPPLGEFIYREVGYLIGFNGHFRFVPLVFGFADLFLLWNWLKRRAGEDAALIGAAIFSVSYFSILASLMVDTDGAILPFFLLLALIAYEHARKDSRWWFGVLVACLLGFLVKASFILGIGALAADLLWERRAVLMTREALRYIAIGAGIIAALILALVVSSRIFPFFDLGNSVRYWEHFATFKHNWFQVAIQAVKAVLYLSPLLVLLPAWATKDDLERVRPLVFFTVFGLLFYLVLFDFSTGALDRYMQFLIVPLVSLAAVMLARFSKCTTGSDYRSIMLGAAIAIGIFALQFLPHAVPPLYPKSAWLGRIASLHWTFLYPFSGGSGPLTFYVSFLFLGLSWIASVLIVAIGLLRKDWQTMMLALLIPLSLGYTGAFAEEYLIGGINGSAAVLVHRAAAFIASDPDIQHVVVYNDNGGYEIQQTGKYAKRLYTSPDFDVTQKAETMNAFSGHYLVVDAPPIDPASIYAKYFATCVPVYQDFDKAMHATVYDCRKAPPIVL